jgi:hypothetical protein
MTRASLCPAVFVAVASLFFPPGPALSQADGTDWNDHWLAAACPIALGAKRARVIDTAKGPAVEFNPGAVGKIVLHCNVEPDTFSTSFVLWAEDDSADGFVEASLACQKVQEFDGVPDELGDADTVVTVTSTNGTGVRYFQEDHVVVVDEPQYLMYVRIVLERTSPSAEVRAYNFNWMVLL